MRLSFACLLLCSALGGCQRASYQSANPLAVDYRLTPLAEPGTSAAITVAAPPVAPLPERRLPGLRLATHRRAKSSRAHAAKVRRIPQLRYVGGSSAALADAHVAQLRQQPLPSDEPGHRRTRGIAFLLAIFLGGLGIHLFYLGYRKRATTYLVLTLVGSALVFIGFVLLLLALFGSGGGAAFVAPLIVGAVLLNVINVLSLVDAVRILTNSLKPSDGEYYPRFFQTRPRPTDQPAPR